MSYILNALRKSEQERKQGNAEASVINSNLLAETPVLGRLPKWMLVFMLINVLLLLYLFVRSYQQPVSTIIVQADTAPTVTAVPDQLLNKAEKNNVLHVENASLTEVQASDQVQKIADLMVIERKPSAQIPLAVGEEGKKNSPEKIKGSKGSDLALNKAKEDLLPAKKSVPAQAATLADAVDEVITEVPSATEVSSATANKPSARDYKVPPPDADHLIPALNHLPEDLRAQIPAIKINVFAYADSAKDRFLIIDMAKYKIGDAVKGGVTLQNILPDSAIFTYNTQRFRIERP